MIYEKLNVNFDFNYNGDSFADGSNQSSQVNPVSGAADARFGKIEAYHVLDATVGWQFNKNFIPVRTGVIRPLEFLFVDLLSDILATGFGIL